MMDRPRLSCAEVDELAGLYVLDALDVPDASEVRAHQVHHPERHAELASLAAATLPLAELDGPIAPPAELRARILEQIAGTPQVAIDRIAASSTQARPPERRRPALAAVQPPMRSRPPLDAAPASTGPSSVPTSLEEVRRRRDRRGLVPMLLAAAAVLALIAVGGWAALVQRGAADAEHRLGLLRDAVTAAAQPGSSVARLAGGDGAEGASGFAVFPNTAPGYIVLAGLPGVASDEVYQAWYLVDGQPESAGLLQIGGDGLAVLEGLEPMLGTAGVALTVEPHGGSVGPTLPIVVEGNLETPLAGGSVSWAGAVLGD